jgi:hypothetical protein
MCVYIYRINPRSRGLCIEEGNLTVRRRGQITSGGTRCSPKQSRRHPDESLMAWVKPHARGSPEAQVTIIQHKYMNNSNTPPVPTLATTGVETGAKLREEWRRHTLGEDVGELRSRWDVQNANFPNSDLVMDELEISLDMLRVLMLNGVRHQVDDTNIVAIDKCAARQRGVQHHE